MDTETPEIAPREVDAREVSRVRSTWARLIHKVYEVDPLECPRCKGPMRVIALIDDAAVIRKILSLGVPVQDVFDALQSTMAALYVNDFNKFGRTYRVQVQADAPFRARLEDIGAVYVRSTTTREMIPLKALLSTTSLVGAEQLERFNGFLAARVLGAGRPGVSSGEAILAVEQLAASVLPEGYSIAWSGQAFQEKRTGRDSAVAFGLALVMVFLILAALYERWLLPFAVVMAVPFAVWGALGFVALRGLENDIYFQIGLVVLIGLAAKNAILIVEFAQRGSCATARAAFPAAPGSSNC